MFCQPSIRSEDSLGHFIEVVQANDLATLFSQFDFFLLRPSQSVSLKPVGFSSGQHVRLCWDGVCLLPQVPPDATGVDFDFVVIVKVGKCRVMLEFAERRVPHPEDSGQLRLIASFFVSHM